MSVITLLISFFRFFCFAIIFLRTIVASHLATVFAFSTGPENNRNPIITFADPDDTIVLKPGFFYDNGIVTGTCISRDGTTGGCNTINPSVGGVPAS